MTLGTRWRTGSNFQIQSATTGLAPPFMPDSIRLSIGGTSVSGIFGLSRLLVFVGAIAVTWAFVGTRKIIVIRCVGNVSGNWMMVPRSSGMAWSSAETPVRFVGVE